MPISVMVAMIKEMLQEAAIMDNPEILFIQLLRFSTDERGSTKNNADVMIQDVIYINDHPYQIKSAICHIGLHMGAGHYIAFININGEWFNCNDDIVQRCTQTDINGREVYILCYHKLPNPLLQLTSNMEIQP